MAMSGMQKPKALRMSFRGFIEQQMIMDRFGPNKESLRPRPVTETVSFGNSVRLPRRPVSIPTKLLESMVFLPPWS